MVYSLEDVQCTINGPGGLVSLGAGAAIAKEGISFEFVEDKDAMIVGGDGSVVHSLHPSTAATVTVRLMKTSPNNALLSALYNLQSSSTLLWGQNVITITNPITGDDVPCSSVAFKKHTGLTWSEDPGMNEWAFNAGHCSPILGVGFGAL
jgi:Protein of unknown function (DUF3277)